MFSPASISATSIVLCGVWWSDVYGSQLLCASTGNGSHCPCLLVEPVVRLSIPSLGLLYTYRHKGKATAWNVCLCCVSRLSAFHRSQEIGMLVRTSNAESVPSLLAPLDIHVHCKVIALPSHRDPHTVRGSG